MSSTLVISSETRSLLRDPALLLPAVVGAGLAVGWLGVDRGISGTRVATDLALSWALVATALIVLQRARWRRSGILLAAAGFALLAADLQWANSHVLWNVGFLLNALWVALLVQLVLTFPEGRPWSRVAPFAIAGAFATTVAGQLVGALVLPDARDVLTVTPHQTLADAVDRVQGILGMGIALVLLVLLVRRLLVLRGPAQRAQAPLLAAAAFSVLAALPWLAWMVATRDDTPAVDTAGRAVSLLVPFSVVAGIVWSRLRRPEASDLVVELRTPGASSLRERLARALGDPTLDLAYRLDDGRYVDVAGRTLELPLGPNRAVTLVTARGEEVAALIHDPALLDEPALVESVRATAGLVLENERLAAEVRAQLAEVRASRARLVAATDAERRRLERNLHDGAQQRLVTLSIMLGLAASDGDASSSPVLLRAQDEVEEAIAELRELARGIHPTLLREEGLEAAVRALARRTPLPVEVEGSVGKRLPDAVELAAYFLVSEALTNVVKHASASHATVRLVRGPATLGSSWWTTGSAALVPGRIRVWRALQDRLEALEAKLVVESEPGGGTTIHTEIPCGS